MLEPVINHTIHIIQEPCATQLNSKEGKSYIVRPTIKLRIDGPAFDLTESYVKVTLVHSMATGRLVDLHAVPLEGHRIDLSNSRHFHDRILSLLELKIVTLPSRIHENGDIRFRFQLCSRANDARLSHVAHSSVGITVYSNYSQMTPEVREMYKEANVKRKAKSFDDHFVPKRGFNALTASTLLSIPSTISGKTTDLEEDVE